VARKPHRQLYMSGIITLLKNDSVKPCKSSQGDGSHVWPRRGLCWTSSCFIFGLKIKLLQTKWVQMNCSVVQHSLFTSRSLDYCCVFFPVDMYPLNSNSIPIPLQYRVYCAKTYNYEGIPVRSPLKLSVTWLHPIISKENCYFS